MDNKTDFILCLLLGYLGAHKFYEKKILVGILYLFTAGLFFIGWIYDCIQLGNKLYKNQHINKDIDTSQPSNTESTNSSITLNTNNSVGNTNISHKILEKKNINFPRILNGSLIKWQYSDVEIKGVQYRNIDFSTLQIGDWVTFEEEPNNEYDSNAIKIIQSKIFLGYIPKGNLQDMILKYSKDDNYMIMAKLNLIDEEKQYLQIHLVFFKKIIESDFSFVKKINASLIKTSKKTDEFDVSRQDTLSTMEENDYVSIEEQFDSNCYLVLNEYSEELGELSESVSDKLREYDYSYEKIARITEIIESSSGKYGAKLEIIILK